MLLILPFSGDSGGPLYRWYEDKSHEQKRAHIIGVVSRGTGCANFNLPGIFSRVSKHLDWIKDTIKSAGC